MSLGSKSYFFKQSIKDLSKSRGDLITYLKIKNFLPNQISYYLDAYDYFVHNPTHYDGATSTEDLEDLPGLELTSTSHDYDYIGKNVSGNFKYMRKSNLIMYNQMRILGKSSLEIFWRSLRLWILMYIILYPLWNKRKMSKEDKLYIDKKYTDLIS